MRKTTSKALCFFLAVLMLFSAFPLTSLAGLSGDGESSGGSGGGHSVTGGYSAGTGNNVMGFRFSLMDNTSGQWVTSSSIDIYRSSIWDTYSLGSRKVLRGKIGNTYYYNVSKYTYFKNYETIALKDIDKGSAGATSGYWRLNHGIISFERGSINDKQRDIGKTS